MKAACAGNEAFRQKARLCRAFSVGGPASSGSQEMPRAYEKMNIALYGLSDGEAQGVPVITADAGEVLSRAVWLSGLLTPQALCSGLGRCGRCRLRFLDEPPPPLPDETEVLGADALAQGWRLACRHRVPALGEDACLRLELPAGTRAARRKNPFFGEGMAAPRTGAAGAPVALGIDLGTTSVHFRAEYLQEKATDPVLTGGQFLNPQAGAGADVVSRLEVALRPGGRARLGELAREAVRHCVRHCEAAGGRVERLCVAGNTAMTAILLDRDVRGLATAPGSLPCHGDETVSLSDLPPLYIPPLMAPFVGGDTSAGLAFLLHADPPRPLVLADLGTNGELALLDAADRLFIASVPLGPALEGIGPDCGQQAGPGSVTAFRLSPRGLEAVCGLASRPEEPVRGISATGYLSLLALLRQWDIMDAQGHFVPRPPTPLGRRVSAGLHARHGRPCLRLPHDLWLSARDVEELLKVKAAFSLALERLLAAAGVEAAGLAQLCLAGALGEHVPAAQLENLGFVPSGLGARLRGVGNAALHGAVLLAREDALRARLSRICAGATLVPLVQDTDFHTQYLRHMRFGV